MKKSRIIILEDDDKAAVYTKDFLDDCGFEVDTFTLSTDALASMKFNKYDVLLLDLSLPDFDGFEVLKAIKNSINISTIVISAHSDIKTKLHAFRLGALDYIVKPYNLEELEARIWALFGKGDILKESSDTFVVNGQYIFFKDKKVNLTQTETNILKILITNKKSTTSREDLASNLSKISSPRSLDYHIKNIRKKINDNSSSPQYLKTEYGVGYRLCF